MKKGFTLAEVLITLAIIGVVAAISIPSVIANTQQQEYKTGLKKAVSVLNSAITMTKTITSESPYENYDLYNYIKQEMSVIKETQGGSLSTDDNGNETYKSANKAFYTTDGMRYEFPAPADIKNGLKLHGTDVIVNNGGLGSRSAAGECGSYGLAENPNNTTMPPCFILVDVNGDRKPNMILSNETKGSGVYTYPKVTDKRLNDIFNILITEDKAIPFGVIAQRAMYNK